MPFDQILAKIGGLMLQAVPTLLLFVVLHLYLKAVLFKPLAKVLAERDALTKGSREKAEAALAAADDKASQYEKAIRDARTELYAKQEAMRRQLIDDQAAQLATARAEADAKIAAAREIIQKETADARATLATQASELADQIARTITGQTIAG